MLARAVPAMLAGPLAGVLLDRLDRKRIMIASDLIRAVVALGFILTVDAARHLAALPAERAADVRLAVLHQRARRHPAGHRQPEELHTANSLTQTTQWTTLTIGTFLAGASVTQFGYKWAFFFNALSFLVSAWSISRLQGAGGRLPPASARR